MTASTGDQRLPTARPAERAREAATHVRDLVKPRLRGVIHQWSALAALAAGVVLVCLSPTSATRVGSAVYAAGLVGLFGTSALYHRVTWSPRARGLMKRADHSMIFLFIASTYTPITLAVLHGTTRVALLVGVWAGALVGIATRMATLHAPRWLTVPLYVGLGWVAVFVTPSILTGAGVAAVVLLYVGGTLYTLGAVAYAARRPDPAPAVFGYHEVFHACTAVAAVCHYISVFLAVRAA